MDLSRLREAEYRLTHRHADGSWGALVEAPLHHGAVEHDAERSWRSGTLFRCESCEEAVLVVPADAEGNPVRPA
jgi:hypothetical protein